MESENKLIIILLAIILVIILVLGIKIITSNKQSVSGAVIEELNPHNKFYLEKIEEPVEVVEEVPEIVEEESEEEFPIEEQFNTFRIIRIGSRTGHAVILYEIESEDWRCPINDGDIIISFDETKTYLGYRELKDFLKDSGITQLIAYDGDNMDAITDIRKATGVSVMVKLGKGARERTEGTSEVEPLDCWDV